MHINKYKYIKFVDYKALTLWDVKRYVERNISFENSIKLREVLQPYHSPISKEEMTVNHWQIISKINFAGNLFLRDINDNKSFKGNLNKVDADSLIYSKINVRHGCIYYHPKKATPFGVSSEYPVYKIDSTRVLGEFLVMILQSNFFKEILNKKVTGISKARLKPDEFLDTEIPLPSLKKQEEIVSAYNAKIEKSKDLELKAQLIENEVDYHLLEMLGVVKGEQSDFKNKKSRLSNNYMYFVRRKNISRWDVYNETSLSNSSLYENVRLGNIIVEKPQYGAGYSSQSFDGKVRYIRITDINEDGSLNEEKVSAKDFSESYVLKENDFLIARSGNTVGKTFLYKSNIGKAIYAGYLIRFKLDMSKVIPEYLLAYTKCTLYKKWIKGNMRVSAQPNINSQQYLESPVILPPLGVQKNIVEYISKQKNEINNLQRRAQIMSTNAIKEFENEIFG